MSLHQTYLTLNVFEIVSLNCIHATYYLPGEKKAAMPAKPAKWWWSLQCLHSSCLLVQASMCINRRKKNREKLEKRWWEHGQHHKISCRWNTLISTLSAIHAIPACSRYKWKIPKLTEPCWPSSRVQKCGGPPVACWAPARLGLRKLMRYCYVDFLCLPNWIVWISSYHIT